MADAQLLLWDIDGTLLSTGGLGRRVFLEVLADVLGHDVAQPAFSFEGRTSLEIARMMLAESGVAGEELDAMTKKVSRRLGPAMAAAREELAQQGRVLPGVVPLLDALAGTPVLNGVLTGNLAVNAVLKLSLFALDDVIDPELGAFGSDHEDRDALVAIALKRVAKKYGPVALQHTWIIGDTPLDFAAAAANGIRCLLVATGEHSYAELAALGADGVLKDLTDTAAALSLLMPSYASCDVEVGDT